MNRSLVLGLLVIVAAAVLGGLYYALSGQDEVAGAAASEFQLAITAPEPGRDGPVFATRDGTTVTINVQSDRDGILHIHELSKVVKVETAGGKSVARIAKASFAVDEDGSLVVQRGVSAADVVLLSPNVELKDGDPIEIAAAPEAK